MDNSLSKALIMIAGVLLAMVVIAFVTFSFREMGTWASTQDSEHLTEQKSKFNKEYEVYDKDLMYGVDVISCLNKALSNNQRIIDKKVVNGETYDETYEVKVKVTTNEPLQESITVYYMKNNKEFSYTTGTGPAGVTIANVGFKFLNTDYNNQITSFEGSDLLKTISSKCDGINDVEEFNLTKDGNEEGEVQLRALLSVSNTLSEIIKNPDTPNRAKEDSWTKAEFRSALYDLKTRKFECTNLTYSEAGRVNYIEFKEI